MCLLCSSSGSSARLTDAVKSWFFRFGLLNAHDNELVLKPALSTILGKVWTFEPAHHSHTSASLFDFIRRIQKIVELFLYSFTRIVMKRRIRQDAYHRFHGDAGLIVK